MKIYLFVLIGFIFITNVSGQNINIEAGLEHSWGSFDFKSNYASNIKQEVNFNPDPSIAIFSDFKLNNLLVLKVGVGYKAFGEKRELTVEDYLINSGVKLIQSITKHNLSIPIKMKFYPLGSSLHLIGGINCLYLLSESYKEKYSSNGNGGASIPTQYPDTNRLNKINLSMILGIGIDFRISSLKLSSAIEFEYLLSNYCKEAKLKSSGKSIKVLIGVYL